MALCLWAATAVAEEPPTDQELQRAAWAAELGQARLEAADLRARAAATAPPLLPDPALGAYREDARGPAGAFTRGLEAEVALPLGMPGLAAAQAAQLRGEAAEARRRAALGAAACELQTELIALHTARLRQQATLRAQERLTQLQRDLLAMAEAGERSGYAADRVSLDVQSHAVSAARATWALDQQRVLVEGTVGRSVTEVTLTPPPPLPDRQALDEAVRSHPALEALRLDALASEQAHRAARRAALPTLVVSGGPRWDAPPGGGEASRGSNVAGQLTVPVFDHQATARSLALAEAADHRSVALQTHAQLRARAHAALTLARQLADTPAPEPSQLWTQATTRYDRGEAELAELLQVASAVEAAELAAAERDGLLRSAHLDVQCATDPLAWLSPESAPPESDR